MASSPGRSTKTHYVMEEATADASLKRTTESAAYFKWLKKHNLANRDKFRIKEVRPWGCVFGIRTGDDWQFYLQENATIRYTTVKTTGSFLSKKTVEVDFYDVSRPMMIREIWPNGGGTINMRHPVGLDLV